MKAHLIIPAGMMILAAAVLLLGAAALSFRSESTALHDKLAGVRDSLMRLERVVDSLKTRQPGLGEYMTTMQLHAAKLWSAEKAANWRLASYELNELDETMEAAEALHARKDSVDISSVLESVRQTQLPAMGAALAEKNTRTFTEAYRQTLAACNGCHRPAGYGFIHIIVPTGAPVFNQQWRE